MDGVRVVTKSLILTEKKLTYETINEETTGTHRIIQNRERSVQRG